MVNAHKLGCYMGTASEKPLEEMQRWFGVTPQITNIYMQDDLGIGRDYYNAYLERGGSLNVTLSTKGTQMIAEIANKTQRGMDFVNAYVNKVRPLGDFGSGNVYITLEHEFRAKVKQGLVTGASADPATYGKALGVLFDTVNRSAPWLITNYWMVGYDRTFEAIPGKNWGTRAPEVVTFDPYGHKGGDTIESISKADITWIKQQPWYKGQPIGLSEFGLPVKTGDAALAGFYSNLRTLIKKMDLEFAVFFNRERDNDHLITTGAYPKAVSAFARSMQS